VSAREGAWPSLGHARRHRPRTLEERRLPDTILPEDDRPLRGAVDVGKAQALLWPETTDARHTQPGKIARAEASMCLVLFGDAAHAEIVAAAADLGQT
jgi:hypothetical protein